MANALDGISRRDDEPQGLTRVIIPTQGGDVVPQGEDEGTDNSLMRAVTPQPSPLIQAIQQLREYLTKPGGFSQGHPGINQIADYLTTDAPGRPRLQLWPERMIRSGLTLAGDVMTGRQPVIDPETGHTAESLTERANDMAGLAFPGALTQRAGTATLGSGPVRRANMSEPLYRIEKSEAGNMQLYGTPGESVRVVDPMNNKVHYEDSGPGSWERAQEFWRKNSKPSWDVVTGDTSGYYEPVMRFPSRAAAKKWVEENGSKPMAPGGTTLMSDSGTPGSAVAGAAKSASPFYSAVEHAVTNAAQDTMSPQQWAGWLKNQPGVKGEELTWTGLGDWLAGQKGKISKKDVQAYLDEHKVEIKDVTKKGEADGDYHHRDMDAAEEYASEVLQREFERLPVAERAKYSDVDDWLMAEGNEHWLDRHGDIAQDWLAENAEPMGSADFTKYSSYQLPGGENYREHLLTLPKDVTVDRKGWKVVRNNPNLPDYYTLVDEHGNKMFSGVSRQPDAEILAAHRRDEGLVSKDPTSYYSSHWDEPNVLAHVRTNERDVGGKPSLHIEEIQSDWHQQGRKQGYKDNLSAGETSELKDLKAKQDAGTMNGDEASRLAELNNKKAAYGGVPNAPFKTTWPELSLKRMIRMAAEEGKDRISWTPGEPQAARYNLSKTLRELHYQPQTGKLMAWSHDKAHYRPVVNQENVPVDKLADFVGKEGAEKLLKQDLNRQGYHILKGEELKVGGEGMKGFYDNMLPKMVEKLGKAHGVKVQKGTSVQSYQAVDPKGNVVADAPTRAEMETWVKRMNDANKNLGVGEFKIKEVGQPVWYFDIPPAWRDQALGKGFPLFAQGIPWPLVPVDHDPFAKKGDK